MTTKGLSTLCIGVASLAISIAPASNAELIEAAGQPASVSRAQAVTAFEAANPRSSLALRDDGSITRVYGKAFSTGPTGEVSAQRFLDQNLDIWGVDAGDLIAQGPFDDGHHVQPIGYLPDTNTYKFTGYYYKQTNQGIPVFRSKLVLMTRNEADNQLVLASSQLYDLREFQMDAQLMRSTVNETRIIANATKEFDNVGVFILDTERVVFAGVNDTPATPTLADASTLLVNGFEKFLVLTDAATGDILYKQSLIHTIDVAGNVSGMSSDGPAADFCAPEISKPLPYLSVGIQGGNSVFSDMNGDFTIPNAGTSPVTVNATLTGQWFRVFDFVGAVSSESDTVTPPGPANLFFNAANNSAAVRAQVNAYVEANVARDFALFANPAYPSLQANEFQITVNRNDGFCPGNAWYDPGDNGGNGSINFCSAGASNPNTAWTSVIYHEYGHHLIRAGGSGQGQYGEGMGDVIGLILLDDPRLGVGFFNDCDTFLRDATIGKQYPCNEAIHICGQIISGCVWDTRNELILTEPDDYQDILNFLAINSILVHNGDLITPQITIDFLTLDDDDGDIGNGTPHYNEIAIGFGAHNMDAPDLNLVDISYPSGQPEFISPMGGTTMAVNIDDLAGSVDPSTVMLMVDTGAGFVASAITQLSPTEFEATFPASDCGSAISYFVTSETTSGLTVNSPSDAPNGSTFAAISAFGPPAVVFADDFESNQGWTVSGNATDGQWGRGTPLAECAFRGAPGVDGDGSGQAYVTDNNAGASCNSDVDGGTTILTSPVMDASGDSTVITYSRWYHNTFGGAPAADIFVVEVSDDGGSSWVNLETVGPAGAEVSGGWITKQFSLNEIPGFIPTNQFRIRFSASDLGDGSVVEAGVDGFELASFDCSNPCVADINGDGALNFFDISAFLTLFGNGDLAADITGDGVLNFFDISAFLSAFSAGCP